MSGAVIASFFKNFVALLWRVAMKSWQNGAVSLTLTKR
jgi:hypothetical protein